MVILNNLFEPNFAENNRVVILKVNVDYRIVLKSLFTNFPQKCFSLSNGVYIYKIGLV